MNATSMSLLRAELSTTTLGRWVLKALAKSCGREEKVVLAALIVFSQIGLIRLTIDPFGYELIPGKEKKQLESSSLYNQFLTRRTAQ